MRTFIAIPLPRDAETMLREMQEKLKAAAAEVRWTVVTSIHLTLRFLGEIDPEAVPRLTYLLRRATASERPFSMRLQGLGAFPNPRNPRVVWCGIEGEVQNLQSLQAKVEDACEAAGFPREERPFRPHLTLGRVKGKRNLHRLSEYIRIGVELESYLAADSFNIYQSTLRPQGPEYRVLETIELPAGN